MSHLVGELRLCEADRELIAGVARGQKRSLAVAVERFHPVVLSLLLVRLKDFGAARRTVDKVIVELFRPILAGQVAAADFALELDLRVGAAAQLAASSDDSAEPMHSLHDAPKLLRRRSAVQAIHALPPDQLTALVLRYHANWTVAQMVGVVGDTELEVEQTLGASHLAVVQAMQIGD